uniref:Uncharacterized protein n=1 Tax=Oryza rufipogon TaxID=4529 RepID=A0A0E0NZT9_ORYRU
MASMSTKLALGHDANNVVGRRRRERRRGLRRDVGNSRITVADFLTHYDDKGLDGCPAMHHLSLPAASLD